MTRKLVRLRQPPIPTGTLHSLVCSEIGAIDFTDDSDAKWVHVATEGLYLGYRGGAQPFAFTRPMFAEAVKNIRSHPQYKAGPDGYGVADVVAWDFDHASEMDPTEGDKPIVGSPAAGWARDFKVVDGADGKAQLHALTRFLEPARTYVKAGKYKWASVAAKFNATDPVTNANRGMVITSIALTNQPFLQALEPLVADRRGRMPRKNPAAPEGVELQYFYKAESAEEAVCCLKQLFGLPATAGIAELLVEVAKVKNWISTGTAPLGVDLDDIVGDMRTILGVDALESIGAVLDRVPVIVQRLVEEEALESGNPIPLATSDAKTQTAGEEPMDLIKIAAAALGCRETEEAVAASVREHGAMRAQLVKLFGCRDDVSVVLEAAGGEQDKGAKARATLGALLKALGVEKPDEAVERVASLMSQADDLAKAMPELKSLRESAKASARASAEADVDALLAARKWDPSLRDALLLSREADPEAFAKKYPRASRVVDPAMLSASLVAGANGLQLSAERAARAVGQPERVGGVGIGGGSDGGSVNLSAYPGANDTQKAMAYLSSKYGKGFEDLPWEEKCKQAWAFLKANRETAA